MAARPQTGTLPVVREEAAMAQTKEAQGARPGDLVIVEGHRVGESRRVGEIIEVLGEPGHEHYRVRWDDGRETVFYPSSDAIVQPAKVDKGRK
jgi:hypothetical protein